MAAVALQTAHAQAAARTGLPDGRGYELVSPIAKHGGDVLADSGRVRASTSGDAVGFGSLASFGDDVLGAGIATEYLSQRSGTPGTTGWQARGIFPQLNPLSYNGAVYGKDTIYQEEFSEDLSKGVLHSYTPLTDDPAVAKVSNLYLRSDLLAPGPGTYTLISSCPACTPSTPVPDPNPALIYMPMVAATTPDLGHVLFEATRNLTPDAPAYPPFPASLCNDNPILSYLACTARLYEWDHGSLRLAGILPDGSPAPISIAGTGATKRRDSLNTISDDGSKVFFTVPPSDNEISGDLYMRLNHATTVKLSASQRTDCADQSPCTGTLTPDPAGPQPASYQIASADGSKVFFATDEQLTDSPGSDLYVYDTTLPVGDPDHLRHVFSDQQPNGGTTNSISGVLGANSDGSYVYFLAQGALLAGQPDLPAVVPSGLYVWHQGTISFIGSVNGGGSTTVSNGWPGLGSRVTPDGTLLFLAQQGAGLTGYDHSATNCGISCTEVYRYRPQSAQLSCVSCNPSGATATAGATFVNRANSGGTQSASHLNHPITDDGTQVYFDTGERLLPAQDVNGKKHDVYQWTAVNTHDCTPADPGYRPTLDGCLALLTTGTSTDDSYFLDANPTGRDVFFSTNQPLVGWDTDDNWDLYDARVGGGLPDPAEPKAECAVGACQGSGSPQTGSDTSPTPGSATLTSTGNTSDGRNARAVISGLSMVSVADRTRLARGHSVRIRLKVDRAGTVTLTGMAHINGKNRRVGSSSVKAGKAGAVSIPFALTPTARKTLQQKRSLSVALTARFANARPKVLTLTLKAPATKK